MKKSALLFNCYGENSLKKDVSSVSQNLANEFSASFIHDTPIKLELLSSYLNTGHIDYFYQTLSDLKYLVEFSDDINRYWYLLRAYSGALSKLKVNQSVKDSKKLHSYYFDKYGDRRILRNEHWFEKKRWEFLDELQLIYQEDELSIFIQKYLNILSENLNLYMAFVISLIAELNRVQSGAESAKFRTNN